MPIEFRCTQCNRLLRTQDETAGKKAKCPECGAILTIPAMQAPPEATTPGATGVSPVPGEHGQPARATPPAPAAGPEPAWASPPPAGAGPDSPFGPIEPPPPSGPGSPFASAGPAQPENPYASPADYTLGAPAAYAAAPGALVPTQIAVGDVFERSWTIYKDKMIWCIGAVLIVGIVNYVVAQIANYASAILGALVGYPAVAIVCMILGIFAGQLFALWLNIGMALLLLKIGRGQEPSMGDLFRGGPYFLTALVAGILVGLIDLVGFVLLIVPGIIFALMFSQFLYLIVDRNVGIVESLELSMRITRGNKATLFLLWILSAGLIFAGMLMCCVGVIFTAPLVSLLWTVAYLAMTGQPTADRLYHGQTHAPFAPGADTSPFAPPSEG